MMMFSLACYARHKLFSETGFYFIKKTVAISTLHITVLKILATIQPNWHQFQTKLFTSSTKYMIAFQQN